MIGKLKGRLSAAVGDEGGAIAILVAVLAVAIVGMAAFAVDLGYARAAQQQLRTSADAASLAGVGVLADAGVYCQPDAGHTSATLVYPQGDAVVTAAAAVAAARDYDSRNREQAFSTDASQVTNTVSAPSCVKYDDPDVTLDPWYPTIVVTNQQQLNTAFGKLLGQDTITPVGSAQAIVQAVAAEYAGLRPFGLCSGATGGLGLLTDAGTDKVVRIVFDKNSTIDETDPCLDGGTPGNWGILDFDNADNGTGNIEEWILNGYRDPLPLPINETTPWQVEGNTGNFNPGALEDELNAIIGKDITLPYYSKATGPGSGATFDIVGFVTVKFCGWKDSQTKYRHAGCEGVNLSTGTFPAGVGTKYNEVTLDAKAQVNSYKDTYLDVQLRGLVSAEDVSNGCQVTGQCDTGQRSVRLVSP